MSLLKKYWAIILVFIIVIGVVFYWFQYRPFKARKDCAWKRMHVDAMPASPERGTPVTQQEIDTHNTAQQACKQKYGNTIESWNKCGMFDNDGGTEVPPLRNDYQPAQPAKPAQDWWDQTNKEEYQSCLRGKGF